MSAPQIPAELEHYLRVGCWAAPVRDGRRSLDLFLLHGDVLRNRLAGLQQAWAEWSWAMKRAPRDGEFFVEMALRVADPFQWPPHLGISACVEHYRSSSIK